VWQRRFGGDERAAKPLLALRFADAATAVLSASLRPGWSADGGEKTEEHGSDARMRAAKARTRHQRDIFGLAICVSADLLHHADGGGGERQSDDSRGGGEDEDSVINCRKSLAAAGARATRTEISRCAPRFRPSSRLQRCRRREQHAQDSGEEQEQGRFEIARKPRAATRREGPTP